jgi:hypothetical protein
MSDIKQRITDLAAILKKGAKLNDAGIIEVSSDAFTATLEGTGLDESTFKSAQKHTSEVFAASMLMAGEIAIPAMKKDKKLNQVSVEIPILKESIAHVIQRTKEVSAGMPKEGEDRVTKNVYGFTSSRYINDVSGTKGDSKKVRAHISALAEAAFGK